MSLFKCMPVGRIEQEKKEKKTTFIEFAGSVINAADSMYFGVI